MGRWNYDLRYLYHGWLYYTGYYSIRYKIHYQAKKNTDYFFIIKKYNY